MNRIKPFKNPIYVTRTILPPMNKVYEKLKEVWETKWVTNFGKQHETLEIELKKYLKVKNLTLFCNGTLALELGIKALNLSGEIITTPFTFPATINSIVLNNIKPVFCDINIDDFNINAEEIENLINEKTTAILPVHVFGNPCEIEKIEEIARNYNLKIIYDAAHCFGVEYKNRPIGIFGDITMFSFHATKIYHTIEGGALTYINKELNEKLKLLRNFGLAKEGTEILLSGTNAKMNEIQALIGLLNLEIIENEMEKRKKLTETYRDYLKNVKGIKYLEEKQQVKYNYQYFPILIDEDEFGLSRDQVLNQMYEFNIFPRKYFFPLSSEYKYLKNKNNISLPNAEKIVSQIMCLPLYGDLNFDDIIKICQVLINLKRK